MNVVTNNTPDFNFLQEISKEGAYRMLFPQPLAGLAILELYTKHKMGLFPNGWFKEAEIYIVLENANKRIKGKDSERQLQDYFNTMISDLQTYFLRYDADAQLYTLKDYAIAFCQHAEETLEANFNPTQIEIICNTLRQTLRQCETEKDVDKWIVSVFNSFKPRLKTQVDYLERQIDQSVKDIREAMQKAQDPILDVLKSIDQKFDRIRIQNEELRTAFREMKNIDSLLEIQLDKTTDAKIGDNISAVRRFFPELKYTLNLIDKRLDRIQPKLRQFFGTLNQTSFNLKVDKFVKFLLAKSTLSKSKQVQFPDNVNVHCLWQATTNFTIVERKNDIFPTQSRPRSSIYDFSEQANIELIKTKSTLLAHSQIDNWVDQIIRQARNAPVNFSEYFFNIVKSTNGDIEMASKVAYSLLRISTVSQKLKIKVGNDKINHHYYPTLSIWEMTLTYHQ